MAFRHMVSMERTPAEKEEMTYSTLAPTVADVPNVPYGLCICLTEEELAKLDLEPDCEVGDTLHLVAMAKVTSISMNDTGDGAKCRIELAITDLALEDEDTETEPD